MAAKRLLSIRLITAFAAAALSVQPAGADEGKLYTADKMSSSTISCITQDAYGFVWVGTEYGLNRFDGYQFVKYFQSAVDSTSLVSNEVTTFHVDSHQQLWIGCRKGLVRYDYTADAFERFTFPGGIEPRVASIAEDADGNMIIGTTGYGLYLLPKDSRQIVRPTRFRRKYADDFVTRAFYDAQGNLWCGNMSAQLTCFMRSDSIQAPTRTFETGCGSVVSSFATDRRGIYIVCTYGILYYDYQRAKLRRSSFDLSALEGNISIRDAYPDSEGNLFIGTSGMGLMMIPKGRRTLQPIDNLNLAFDLSSANVNEIVEDRSGNLWVGCYRAGLVQLMHNQSSFSSWLFSTQNYKLGSSVSSIAPAKDGAVLCVVQKSGIYRFDRDGKIERRLKSPEAPISLFRDAQGRYWLGTETSLYEYFPDTETAVLKVRSDGWGVNRIIDDRDNHLFFCTDGRGLSIFNTKTGQTETFSMYDDDDSGNGKLVNNWIRALCYDSSGLLWIGSVDGLGCMNPHDRTFRPLGWDTQMKGLKFYALHEMPDANMLIGTEAGLYIFRRATGELAVFPGSEEMQGKSVYSIIADHTGDLWMTTPNEIWHYNMGANTFESYNADDAIGGHEYVVGAGILAPDGRIVFGNNDGLTAFYPTQVKGSVRKLDEVFLTNFMVNGERRDCRSRSFVVAPGHNNFALDFSMFDYRKTDNTTFLYRINQGDWQTIPEGTHSVSFNEMRPGSYNFEVQALSNGNHAERPCRFSVVVDTPWHLSPWAIACYALLLLAVVAFIVNYYNSRQKKQLEEAKMRFLINATHDIRSPLTLIMEPLKKIKDLTMKTQDAGSSEISRYWNVIDRNAQRLLLLVNQILDERKIDMGQMQMHFAETDMVKFIQDVSATYQYHAQQRNIRFTFDHDDSRLPVWIDRVNFEKALTNLLSNAFKYTSDGGQIRFILRQDGRNAILQLQDSGIGFQSENTERLFERFTQGSHARNATDEGWGIGLNLTRSIVELHGGDIRAYNRTDGQRGACFEVCLPLGNSHLRADDLVTADDADTEPAAPLPQRQPTTGYRILVADDDHEMAHFIATELGRWYRFDVVENGRQALDAIFSRDYDLLISDVIMPEMDGITLLKQLRSVPRLSDLPVILLTSKSEVEDRLKGLRQGANAYITKPFNMDELHQQIDMLIDYVRRLRGKFSGAVDQEDKVEDLQARGNDDALMERITRVVNDHLDDSSFNVERLTQEVGISRAQLHRKMKDITGISASDFIRNLRMQQAERLIQEGKINITQVAYTVGFNNQSHFSTVFHKYYGMTPSEYAAKCAAARDGRNDAS